MGDREHDAFDSRPLDVVFHFTTELGGRMRSILLYLLGVPIPIIILIALLYH